MAIDANRGHTDIDTDTAHVARFMTGSGHAQLRGEVIEKTRQHIVDTIAAALSGLELDAGIAAARAIPALRGASEARVMGSGERLPAWAAAMINAMLAHADETDDSHEHAKFHPGCGIVPAALAVCEREGRSGYDLVRAVAAGYDLGARFVQALGVGKLNPGGHSTHAFGALMGCGGAVASLMKFDDAANRHYLSYLGHELSGLSSWVADRDHVQKAYVFGAMGAKNAIVSAQLCSAGWTGAADVIECERGFLQAYGTDAPRRSLRESWNLGDEILGSNIKKWCVGSPIQAAIDSLEVLKADIPEDTAQIAGVEVELRADEAFVVAARAMPNISLPHLAALYLVDRNITFASVHDVQRMTDPRVLALSGKVRLIRNDELQKAGGRQALVRVILADGRVLAHHTSKVRGTWMNPMSQAEVNAKAEELIQPILGTAAARELLAGLWRLEELDAAELAGVMALTDRKG